MSRRISKRHSMLARTCQFHGQNDPPTPVHLKKASHVVLNGGSIHLLGILDLLTHFFVSLSQLLARSPRGSKQKWAETRPESRRLDSEERIACISEIQILK